MLVQSASIRGTKIKWKLFVTIRQENLSFIDMAKHHEAVDSSRSAILSIEKFSLPHFTTFSHFLQ